MTTTPERAGREGDSQPLPTASHTPHMHDLVAEDLMVRDIWSDDDPVLAAIIEDLAARKAVGIKRYGQPLQAFNGRDAVLDAYEEALDLSVYLRQAIYEIEDQQRRTNSGSVGSLRRLEESYDETLNILANLKDVLYVRR